MHSHVQIDPKSPWRDGSLWSREVAGVGSACSGGTQGYFLFLLINMSGICMHVCVCWYVRHHDTKLKRRTNEKNLCQKPFKTGKNAFPWIIALFWEKVLDFLKDLFFSKYLDLCMDFTYLPVIYPSLYLSILIIHTHTHTWIWSNCFGFEIVTSYSPTSWRVKGKARFYLSI